MGEIVTEKALQEIPENHRERRVNFFVRTGLLELMGDDGIKELSEVTHLVGNTDEIETTVTTATNEEDFIIPAGIEQRGPWYIVDENTKFKGKEALQKYLKG